MNRSRALQVARNVEGTESQEMQTQAVQSACAAFDSAFTTLVSSCFADSSLDSADYTYTTVLEGDHPAMAQHGLFSGVVQPALKSDHSLTIASANTSDNGESGPGALALDADAVETRMAQLLDVVDTAAGNTGDTASQSDALTERDMLAAQANQARFPQSMQTW